MPLDVYATDDEAVVIAAVPGMTPEDLDLTVHQNTATVGGSLRSVADTEETTGSPQECIEQLQAFIDAGATTITLRLTGYD